MTDYSSNNKRIAKNTIFLYIRSILLLIINLYTSRVTLEVLGVEDYGIYQVVGGIVAMFTMLSSTLSSASQRFITYALGENNLNKLKKVFSTCISLHLALGGIVVIILEICGLWFLSSQINIPIERLDAATNVMHFSIITFFVGVVTVPYNAVIIAHERMSAFAYISIVEGILKLGTVFILTIISYDKLTLYAILHFLISLFLCLVYFVYTKRRFDEAKRVKLSLDKKLFKEMFAFAGWNLFGNGSLVLRNQGIDILLNIYFGVVVNAAKGVSNQVQNAVHALVGNFTTALKPQMTKAIAQQDYTRVYDFINNGSRYTFLMMLILTVPIIVVAPDLLSIWLVEVPDYSVSFVRWTMIYLLLDSFSRMLIHSILSQGNIRNYQIVVGGTKLLAIPIACLCLIIMKNPLIGIWVNILLEFVCLIERLYYNHKLLNYNPRIFIVTVLLKCTVLFALCLLLSFLFAHFITDNFFMLTLFSFIATVIMIYHIGINQHEKIIVFRSVKKILNRI